MTNFPRPELAVTIIAVEDSDRILTTFNPRWGSFTLPMTKRKSWIDPQAPAGNRQEDLVMTATRAAAEALGRTLDKATLPHALLKEIDYRQSDSEGIWKVYSLYLFGLKVPQATGLAPGIIGEWLNPTGFRNRDPISPTARYVIDCLDREGQLPPWP